MNFCKFNRHVVSAFICTVLLVGTFLVSRNIFLCKVASTPSTLRTPQTYIESDDITSIKQFIPWTDSPIPQEDRAYLVIFDIDNTIAEPAGTQLGSDQWFYAKIADYEKRGKPYQDAVDATVKELMELQEKLRLQPVEKQTVPFINELQKRNFTTIALTARSCTLIHRTIEQLREIDINFTNEATFKQNFSFAAPKAACYKSGIIFTGANDKGEVLKAWLKHEQYTPKEIIFIDDKMHNLEAVGKAARDMGISFAGIRYNRLDKKIKSFRLKDYEEQKSQPIEAYTLS